MSVLNVITGALFLGACIGLYALVNVWFNRKGRTDDPAVEHDRQVARTERELQKRDLNQRARLEGQTRSRRDDGRR
jgi:hypothetical protein